MTMWDSKYEETMDDTYVECPYCGKKYQPDEDFLDEEERQEECGECGKTYWLRQVFCVDHWTRPDCEANGEKHNWRPDDAFQFCETCGYYGRK